MTVLPDEVARIHDLSDVDSSHRAQHHTLGTKATQAAPGNHNHLSGVFVTGDLKFTADNTQTGWLECDGAAVSRTTYANLFAVIGTTFGAGDGSTTFNVPDMRDRLPVGKSGTKALGATGGADTYNLQHNHVLSDAGQAQVALTSAAPTLIRIRTVTATTWTETQRSGNLLDGTEGTASVGAALTGNTDNAGSTTQSVVNKYLALYYLIKT